MRARTEQVANSEAKSEFALSGAEIAHILAPFCVKLSDSQVASVSRYAALLLRWNQSMSLTTVEEPEELIARHFGESLFAASLLPLHSGRLADAGTGAGFPGLALKMARPELSVTLIESNRKKCAFLAEVQRELHFSGVEIKRSRYEDSDIVPQSIDYLCARALGNYGNLLRWSKNTLSAAGCIVLWVGSEDSVLVSKTPGWSWDLPIPIPGSARRVILVGKPLPPR